MVVVVAIRDGAATVGGRRRRKSLTDYVKEGLGGRERRLTMQTEGKEWESGK